jgi:ABC-type transport system involved in multi-copper enzyme maturation permease subunit
MTDTLIAETAPYRSAQPAGRDGFAALLRAEWTKFRSVRGWLIATAVAAVLMVLFGILAGNGSHSSIATPEHPEGIVGHPYVPIGPGGEAVTDSFYFVHQPLDGDGAITARVTSLTGGVLSGPAGPAGPGLQAPALTAAAVQPWTKAGLIIKANTSQGSAYAAIMVTGGNGVRMQYNYTGDIAGPTWTKSTASPQWLRLTRSGDTITGYASSDGTTWTKVGTVRLTGLPTSVPTGMFATSPGQTTFAQSLGSASGIGNPTVASATFDSIDLQGGSASTAWTGTRIGDAGPDNTLGFQASGDSYTVLGSGDIAPGGGAGSGVEHTLIGAFATLTVMVVLAVLFISTEYRRGLIRTSMTASPHRGRILAAKAVVIGAVTFVTGLIGAVIAIPISEHFLRANGNFIPPITWLTEVRIVAGTAALLAVAAVLALAIGTIMRRSAAAVAAAIVLVVLPYILGTAGVLSAGASQWVLRIFPAAAFAIQQSVPAYHQVDGSYIPSQGYYPLAPWAGFAVLCAWAAVALGVAAYLLRRRDV